MILDCRKFKFISILISKIALNHFFKVIQIDFDLKGDQYFFKIKLPRKKIEQFPVSLEKTNYLFQYDRRKRFVTSKLC